MPDCASIDPLITPYVDGDIGAPERRSSTSTSATCPPCYSRVAAERAVSRAAEDQARRACRRHRLAGAARSVRGAAAPVRRPPLPARVRRRPGAPGSRRSPSRRASWSIVGRGVVYVLTERSSTRAGRRADRRSREVLRHEVRPARRRSRRKPSARWRRHSAGTCRCRKRRRGRGSSWSARASCLYGRGQAAHLMYRHNGQPVSVFMLPKTSRPESDRGRHRARGRHLVDRRPHVRAGRARAGEPAEAAADLSRMTAVVQTRAALS